MRLPLGIAIVGLLLAGLHSPADAKARYGVVVAKSDSAGCLTISGPRLPEGTRIVVVFDDPQAVLETVVGSVLDTTCAKDALGLEGTSYSLPLGGSLSVAPAIGIGVVAPGAKIGLEQGVVLVRTPGVRTPLTFATCASGEGLHLTAWRGGRRVWHQYYYIGVDLESNCTEKEVGE